MTQRRGWFFVSVLAAIALIATLFGVAIQPAAAAPSPNIVISQVYGGGGNSGAPYTNDYVELFNRGNVSVSLAGWSIQYASATGSGNFGASSAQLTELPDITLAPGQYLLIQEAGGATGGSLPTPDVVDSTPINLSATAGKLALANSATSLGCNGNPTPCPANDPRIVDLVGYGSANYAEGSSAPAPSNTTADLRAGNGCTDTDNNSADFAAAAPAPRTSASPLNPCGSAPTPTATDTTPTLTPTPVTLTPIHTIQGAAHTSPLSGQTITTTGIVTAKRSNGFYLQDPNPDTDDATSEAIFVFTSSAPSVNVGDALTIRGTVSEFRAGGASSTNLSTTQISGATITVNSTGNPLPATTIIGTGGRTPPTTVIEDDAGGSVETSGAFDPANDGIDFYESLEGMRVQLNNAVAVAPTNVFGTTNQNREIAVLGDDGAGAGLRTPRGGIVIRPDDFNPERIMLNDLIVGGPILPTVNVGDRFPGVTVGVLDYSFGNFKLEVTALPPVASAGLSKETTMLTGTPDKLTVATFNLENLDVTDGPAKFNGLATRIVDNLSSPDVIGLEEIQDNNGPANDSIVDADVTYNTLIDAIVAAGGPRYEFRQINPVDDQDGGEPGGNIRVGFLFNPARVSFIDRPGGTPTGATTVVNGANGPELSASPGRIDPTNPAFNDSRKPLAGEFLFNGNKVFIIANHFNSKGGDQPLFGRFQPPTRSSEVQRRQQATIVANFVTGILTADANANVVVLGDLNDFQFSPAVTILKDAGLTALIETLPENERYTYNFEGNAQAIDQILVSQNLVHSGAEYDIVHVNTEFADQASDHDPPLARLILPQPNRAPVAEDQSVTTDEDTPAIITLSASDADNDPLTYTILAGPRNGTLTGDGANRTYTPNANVNGPDSFTFKVNDGKADSNVATVTITVNPINDAPNAANDRATVAKNGIVTIAVLANDSDVDGDPLTVTGISGGNAKSTIVVNADGTITYQPKPGFKGSDTFNYTISDGNGGSASATVTITVAR